MVLFCSILIKLCPQHEAKDINQTTTLHGYTSRHQPQKWTGIFNDAVKNDYWKEEELK